MGSQPGAVVCDATHRSDFQSMIVMLERPSHSEQQRTDYSVSEHHEQCTSNTQRLHSGDAEENQTHVGD